MEKKQLLATLDRLTVEIGLFISTADRFLGDTYPEEEVNRMGHQELSTFLRQTSRVYYDALRVRQILE